MIALHILVTAVGVGLGVLYPFLSVILSERGFDPAAIGLISSLGAVGFTIAVPAWGHVADVRLGRPRTLQVCALGAGAAVFGLLFPVPSLVVVALLGLFWIFESSWQPLADAITVNAVRGGDYARVRLFTSAGFAIATIAAGFIYAQVGYDAAFVFFAGSAVVLAVSAAAIPDVGRADLDAHRTSAVPERRMFGFSFGSSGVALGVAPKLRLVLVATTLLHIGMISGFTFLPLRLVELGGGAAEIALSSGLSAGTEIPAMLVAGAVAWRIGLRAMFVGSTLLYALCFATWTVIDIPAVIVATRAVTGIAFAGVLVSVVLTIARLLPPQLQATGQSLFQMSAFGLGAILANVVGGLLYQNVGHAAVFGLGAGRSRSSPPSSAGWRSRTAVRPRRADGDGRDGCTRLTPAGQDRLRGRTGGRRPAAR